MNLPNQITVGRLLVSLVLFGILIGLDDAAPGRTGLITCFFLFIAVTASDALDGYYARKYGQVSTFGRIADPAVDKITVTGTLILLCAAPWTRPVLEPWMVVLIVAREFTITGLRSYVESRGIDFGADWSGKLKMIVQSVAIPGVFFFKIIEQLFGRDSWAADGSRYLGIVLMWAALGFTVYSGVEYVVKATRILRRVEA